MTEMRMALLKKKCGRYFERLEGLNNPLLMEFVAKYIELCNPDSVFVRTDDPQDAEYIREKAIERKEEIPLKIEGHTVHFDGYFDQARDKDNTKYLLRPDEVLSSDIRSCEREKGLIEVHDAFKDIMAGREVFVGFFCLGPANSIFSIPAVQITDSAYVAHSEGILYRSGYEEFKRSSGKKGFFKFLHSAGRLENGVSKDIYNRKIYIDLETETVYSVHTQYAGNTVGLKKLAMRLAIKRASEEGWLTEHMFIMGVKGPGGARKTYFTGSFPSACGKTATSMLEGETIVGDDIAYLRRVNGRIYAVNVEKGIFGIIRDVNEKNDPNIYKALTSPGEVIFSNVLIAPDKTPFWLGKSDDIPNEGMNFAGEWFPGKKGPDDREIPPAHKNARYTIHLESLANCDENLDNPEGVPIKGIIYGGRDSDTSVPVEESFNWRHGILTQAAAIESETTAATLGEEGVRKFNLMANLDFLSIPIGRYIQNNLDIVENIENPPLIFHVNYFLRGRDGRYLNGIKDKHVWLKWMELRVNKDAGAVKFPTGLIPRYEDLKKLFNEFLGKDYKREEYEEQFTLRIPERIAKIDRIKHIYHTKVFDTPYILLKELNDQRLRLEEAKKQFGDYVSPFKFE